MSKKVKQLESEIKHHSRLYYNGDPEISDYEFDLLMDELRELDPNSKVLKSVGSPIDNDGWEKIKHQIPMGSLNKAANKEELKPWIDKYIKEEVFIIEKLDGISINCVYKDGKLIQAITRGSGEFGENIFDNVMKMEGVKKELPLLFTGSLRGEIILTKTNHKKFFSDTANVRNSAAGTARRLEGDKCEHLNILFYQVLGNAELDTEVEQMEYIKDNLKLNTPNFYFYSNKSDIKNPSEYIESIYKFYNDGFRDGLDYEIDGLVIKVNSLEEQEKYGISSNRPKAAIALKFPHQTKETVLRGIEWSVGNSGRICPVGVFDKIPVDGVDITKASLHNIQRIIDLKLNIGDRIIVSRRNGVIPYVEKNLDFKECNDNTAWSGICNFGTLGCQDKHKFNIPLSCPICNGKTEMQGENFVCISTDICPAQIKGKIANYINAIGVLEWGEKIIDKLVESGKVKLISDLYKLSIDDLSSIDRMGEKSATKCYSLLWKKEELPLDIFLGALSIPNAASSTIRMLINEGYDNLEKILNAKEEELVKVKGIGNIKAELIVDGLKRNKKIINDIMKQGIKIKEINSNGKLLGKRICITGATEIKRGDLQKMIAENGGSYAGSISKSCTHLIIADPNSNSVKANGARDMGIKLISESDFLEMVK